MQLPGSSFVHPDSPLRDALTAAAARQVTRMTGNGNEWMPIGKMIDEKVVVNGIVALLATGGSTNHTMHLVAMARSGIQINWDDFSDLSDVVPLMARLYPNGPADINHFQAAGGVRFWYVNCSKQACCMKMSIRWQALVCLVIPLNHG